jgi:hypothetical protein
MVPNKKHNYRKKSQSQANNLSKALRHDTNNINITYDSIQSDMMAGSDQPNLQNNNAKESPKPKKVRYKVTDFFKEHGIEFLIGTVAFSFVCWVIPNMFDLKSDSRLYDNSLNIIREDIDKIEASMDSINTDYVTKELLKIQLDSVKESITDNANINRLEIENSINLIEKQIEYIQNSN